MPIVTSTNPPRLGEGSEFVSFANDDFGKRTMITSKSKTLVRFADDEELKIEAMVDMQLDFVEKIRLLL